MKINILYFAVTVFFITSGCQKKIQNVSLIQTKTDSLINTIKKVDTLAKIESKPKVDTLAKIESKLKVENFTLSIEPKIFNNSTMGKAKVVIANNTNKYVRTGLEFFVDFSEDNSWKRLNINEGVIIHLIAYDIKDFTTREFEINFKSTPYNFKPGKYRITKAVTQTATKTKILVSTEFIVE